MSILTFNGNFNTLLNLFTYDYSIEDRDTSSKWSQKFDIDIASLVK